MKMRPVERCDTLILSRMALVADTSARVNPPFSGMENAIKYRNWRAAPGAGP